ncbi:TorD/DmsD family molecular chaperone [Thermanaeromonas sp. C210]|uniref:TorD/DmsD family molecular chaperone n=1 Tax=Thermanaeromonas sp. C210 TaxID=2731925 RepID=UPI00155BDB59|nr:molecular chaperone TorD family protein [Thermanaeromonas sp. C210]GFN23412.1 molecular chaperone TorD [Thermanaeromonas sp. C210]
MDFELLADWLKGREIIYGLLARLYREGPSREILAALDREGILARLAEEESNEEVREGCRRMQQELSGHQNDLDAYCVKLKEEYNRLFVGPGHLEAPPWESVYRSPDRLLFGEETLAVREFYHSFGLVNKNLYREPDDHLSLELEFMAWLCAQSADCLDKDSDWQRYLQGQQDFLRDHLIQWVPAWSKDMFDHAKTEFFRGLAQFTRGFILSDLKEVGAALNHQ